MLFVPQFPGLPQEFQHQRLNMLCKLRLFSSASGDNRNMVELRGAVMSHQRTRLFCSTSSNNRNMVELRGAVMSHQRTTCDDSSENDILAMLAKKLCPSVGVCYVEWKAKKWLPRRDPEAHVLMKCPRGTP